MPNVFTATRDAIGTPTPTDRVRRDTPKLAFRDGASIVMVPYAPEESDVSGLAGKWVETDRPGIAPLLEWGGASLKVIALQMAVGYPDHRSIEQTLGDLEVLAGTPSTVTITGYHGRTVGPWRITSLSYNVTRLNDNNQIVQADVSMSLTLASDAVLRVGPLTGGAQTNPTSGEIPTGASVPTHDVERAASIRFRQLLGPVASGEGVVTADAIGKALTQAAIDSLGDAGLWPQIADQVGILDPRRPQIIYNDGIAHAKPRIG